jgi:hypothetical protein
MSNLDAYISKLMHDDDALHHFLVDPISAAEKEGGCTKAERAVLRRTVQHLSNNSVNGYGLQRDLNSYRRSIRLLQNVLHNHSAGHLSGVMDNGFIIRVYYPVRPAAPTPFNGGQPNNYTGNTNQNLGYAAGSYARYFLAHSPSGENLTIKQVMDAATIISGPNTGQPLRDNYKSGPCPQGSQPNDYVLSFDVGSAPLIANLCDYNLHDDYVFWFWSLGGNANPGNSGQDGESFAGVHVSSSNPHQSHIVWQLIAPDRYYGFAPCYKNPNNQYYESDAQRESMKA